jgi:hypothetical protein
MKKEYGFYQDDIFSGGPPKFKATGMIDLRHVSSVVPWPAFGDGFLLVTLVTVGGVSIPILIKEDYDRFVLDWQSVKS